MLVKKGGNWYMRSIISGVWEEGETLLALGVLGDEREREGGC
jgi:hypothetical protein